MHFHSSHIFHEGNHVADALANYGTPSTGFVWWDTTPKVVASNRNEDRFAFLKFRVPAASLAKLLLPSFSTPPKVPTASPAKGHIASAASPAQQRAWTGLAGA
ncbi:hypothetical protein ACLB2K_035177 [Fragaria x ananassa]